MLRTLLVLAAAAGGAALAHQNDKAASARRVVSERDIAEKLDGKEARATVVELTLDPGQGGKVRGSIQVLKRLSLKESYGPLSLFLSEDFSQASHLAFFR